MKMSEANERLRAAINACADADRINIKGKAYAQVSTRVAIFRQHFLAEGRIVFVDREITPEVVRMRALVEIAIDPGDGYAGQPVWTAIAEGQAEEYRSASQVNKTSAVENCETSAMGRALAQLGLLGGEYASANEVVHAIESKAQHTDIPETVKLTKQVFDACETYEQFAAEWQKTLPMVREVFSKQEQEYLSTLRARLKNAA